MIEVNLYSITGNDVNATVGRCIDRTRFDKESLGVSVLEFVKGFLKTNSHNIEAALGNADLTEFINSNRVMRNKDFATLNYYLARAGFLIQIINVTEDEENPASIPEDTVEWNIIDRSFIQYDYPTATKIVPADGADIASILKGIVENLGFFDSSYLGSVRNPLMENIQKLEKVKELKGSVDAGITTKIYEILDQLGIKIFVATSE